MRRPLSCALLLIAASACGESAGTGPNPVPSPPSQPVVTLTQLSLDPQTIVSGAIVRGTITLSAPAPAGGTVVALTSSHAAASAASRPETVPPGETSHVFIFGTGGVTETAVDVTITATLGTSTRTAVLQIQPFLPRIARFWVDTRVLGSQSGSAYVELDRPAPSAGARIAIAVSDTVVRSPDSVFIPGGTLRGDFTFATGRPSQDVRVTFTATYGSSTENTTILVLRGVG
jgi:hypothetical protein